MQKHHSLSFNKHCHVYVTIAELLIFHPPTRISLPDFVAYSMTKGAINTMTFTLAKQLGARGITVNAILPGFIKTDMNAELLSDPMMKQYATTISAFNRLGEVEDIADTAHSLLLQTAAGLLDN